MSSVNFGGGKGVDFLGNIKLPRIGQLSEEQMDIIQKPYKTYQLTIEEIGFIESQ